MQDPPFAHCWRFVLTPPLAGAHNMAVDVALMARAQHTGEAVFRVYTWATPTLSLGRNQTAIGRYHLDRVRARGVDIVRRPTGGRAILHWREVTYSVTAPIHDGVSLRHSYGRINQVLKEGLRRLGIPIEVAASAVRAPRPTDAPCFVEPSEGEMIANGRKLVGSAQWRDGNLLLQHGSILVKDDQAFLGELMVQPPESPTLVGTLSEALGRTPEVSEVAAALFDAVRAIEDPKATELDPIPIIEDGARSIGSFLNEQWTWRR